MNTVVAEYVQDSEFQELLKGDLPLVVDCTASWCGPCKLVSPLMDRLAASYEGKATVVKLDVDKNKTTAKEYGIRSIPAVLLFKNGELVETIVGVSPYERFSEALEPLI